jgi:hypothetical protein
MTKDRNDFELSPAAMANRLHSFTASTLDHLDAHQKVIAARLAQLAEGSFDPDLSQAGAALTRSRNTASAELRKIELHDRKISKTPEQRHTLVLEYLRQLDPERRAEVQKFLSTLENQRSVLG